MSLVELRQSQHRSDAVSGGAMDRVVERRRIDKRVLIAGGAAAALLLVLLFWLFAPRSDSLSVIADRLTIATVERGV
jgi:HlyD family secretion protein